RPAPLGGTINGLERSHARRHAATDYAGTRLDWDGRGRGKERRRAMRLEAIEPRLGEIEVRQKELARRLWQVSRSTDRQDEARQIGIEMSALSAERERLLKSAERQQ